MSFNTIGKILFFVSLIVMVVWGAVWQAWHISWIAAFVGVMLMVIFGIIEKGKNKK